MDSSFNAILDHVENSSFLPYAGPQCTPSKRKVDNGEKKRKKEKKRMSFFVATTSFQPVDRLNDDRWNAACSCQFTDRQTNKQIDT